MAQIFIGNVQNGIMVARLVPSQIRVWLIVVPSKVLTITENYRLLNYVDDFLFTNTVHRIAITLNRIAQLFDLETVSASWDFCESLEAHFQMETTTTTTTKVSSNSEHWFKYNLQILFSLLLIYCFMLSNTLKSKVLFKFIRYYLLDKIYFKQKLTQLQFSLILFFFCPIK